MAFLANQGLFHEFPQFRWTVSEVVDTTPDQMSSTKTSID